LLLVGPRQDGYGGTRFDELVKRSNVCWVGERSYAQIPSYLRLIDVGLTPYASSLFNNASSPLTTLEYLAAGRGSVSTDLPGVRAFATDQVTIATTPESFADAVQRTMQVPRTPVGDRGPTECGGTTQLGAPCSAGDERARPADPSKMHSGPVTKAPGKAIP
jgi:teichuronic acid biosynthesis glycosyltransferase TuaH